MSTLSAIRRRGATEYEAWLMACGRRGHTCRDYGYQGYLHPARSLGHHKHRRWQKRRRHRWIRRLARADILRLEGPSTNKDS